MTEQPLAFVVVVTDGAILRTLHPSGLGEARAAVIEHVVRDHLFGAQAALPVPIAPMGAPPVTPETTLTQREMASAQGFTGDACRTCGSFTMRRVGTCLTCQACGSTTGCS